MKGNICLITGATSGIGKAAAFALAAMDATLILVGRNADRGARILRQLRASHPSAQAEFCRTDLSALAEVRELASAITARYDRIDVLINNAGARFDTYQKSVDGIEMTFATNHLSHFLLTCLLLKHLQQAPAARVITVGSSSHSDASADGDWYLEHAKYDRRMAYAKSKLANIMFAYELAERLRDTRVTSNAVDPGGVATNLGRNNGIIRWMKHIGYYAMKRQLISPNRGAETIVYLAASLDLGSGKYYFRKREAKSSQDSYNEEAARKLWELSVTMTDLNERICPSWPHLHP